MANRISVVIDVATRNAESALKNFTKGIRDAEGATGKLKAGFTGGMDAIKSSGLAAGVAFGTLVKGAGDAINAASDLSESINAVNVSFGDAAEGVHELAEDSVESMGLSQRAFNEAAVGVSAFAKTVAGDGGDVAGTLDELMTRAGDFASVMNLDVSEAMNVFRSGLSGETEPLKRFGIDLSAAAVESYALANGLVESKSEMTESIKVQARYGLLLERTAGMAGDFAKTSDGLANSQRRLQANIENLQAELGTALLPVVESATNALNDTLTVWKALENAGPVKLVLDLVGADGFLDFGQKALKFSSGIPGLSAGIDLLTGSIDKYNSATSESEHVVEQATKRALGMADASDEATDATVDLTDATEDNEDATVDATGARKRSTDAIRDAIRATNDMVDATLSAIDSSLGFRNAQADAGEAITEYYEKAGDATTTTQDLEAAQRDAEGAILSSAAAAVKLAEDQAAASGATFTAEQRANTYRAELFNLMQFTDGPLREALQRYINQLNSVPRSIYTNVGVTRTGDFTPTITGKRAAGGPVSAGGAYLVGENGPEILQMGSTSGNVIPNSRIGAAAGNSITVNVNSADPNMVVNALRQYFRSNSKPSWWPA